MRKLISTLMTLVMMAGFTVAFTGCTDESGVKSETKITAPDGSQTKETREIKIDKSGKNAPAAPSEKANP